MTNQTIQFSVQKVVDENRTDILSRLPKYLSPSAFLQLCYALDRDPNSKLFQAAKNNPRSLLNAILKAADCGLMIGSVYDHCWLIPYRGEIQFHIGYRGMVYQLVRAGAVLKINAACVYEGDKFRIEFGDREHLVHKPNLTDDRRRNATWLFDKRNIVGAYAIAWLPAHIAGERTAATLHRWCSLGEVEAARLKSQVPDGPAWTHNYPAMAAKTAVRRLTKFIEVCGPTAANKEAWERFDKTIEMENTQYRSEPEQPDDLPGSKGPARSAPRSGNPAAAREGTDRVTPPPPPEEIRPAGSVAFTPTPSDDDNVLGE